MLAVALKENRGFKSSKEYWLSILDETFDPDHQRVKVAHNVNVVRKLRYMQSSNWLTRIIDELKLLLGFQGPPLMRSRAA